MDEASEPEHWFKHHNYPTLRPQRINCTPPAIELFPQSFISPAIRNHGGVIVHVLVAAYAFLGIWIVCKDYFVPSIVRIHKKLEQPQNVVGATFMAIGSSAPQLAFVLVGVLTAKDDIGVYGSIQSSAFKLLCIIPICVLFKKHNFKISGWPAVRDVTLYLISGIVLLVVMYDEFISWLEAFVMVICYAVYCLVLKYSSNLGRLMQKFTSKPQTQEFEKTTNLPVENVQDMDKSDDLRQSKSIQESHFIVKWCHFITKPIHCLCFLTIPDVRNTQHMSKFVMEYFIALLWMLFYGYMMVWMVTIVGYTFGIPDSVMAVTFSAAAVSVPAIINSILAIRNDLHDMLVSNILGSIIFDFLVCLGLNWFIQTAIIKPRSLVNVFSKGIMYTALSLFSIILFFLFAILLNSQRFDSKLGFTLMIGYIIYASSSALYELNIFGKFHPLKCKSNY